ncbi:MAG: hypothetical protein H6687_00750 [Bacillales bacterium]|nr:hypothetical protein [Bacillales bacterium]
MKKSSLLYLFSMVLLVLFGFTLGGCTKTTEEVPVPYYYSFSIDSVSYEYEITVNMEYMSASVTFKQNNVAIGDSHYFTLSQLTDSVYKFSYVNELYFTGSLNDDQTFSPVYINDNIEDFIFGYEFYAGEYTLASGNNTTNITLNIDGTALVGDKSATFHPWQGNSVILSVEGSSENAILSVDSLEDSIELTGYTTSNIKYIFGGNKYYLDGSSVYDLDTINTELVMSANSSDAYFVGKIMASDVIYTVIYFGTYEKDGDKTILTYPEDKTLNFKVGDYYFDFYYTEYTSGDSFIKIYSDLNKVSYNYEKADLVSINDSVAAIQTYSNDEIPVKATRMINLDTLAVESIYWGDYSSSEIEAVYTNSQGIEISIVDDDTLYYLVGDTTYASKTYYVCGYTKDSFDSNIILLTDFFNDYYFYLYGDTCFSLQSSSVLDEAKATIYNPEEPYYYSDPSSSSLLYALYISKAGDEATLATYTIYDGYISINSYANGDLTESEGVYTITVSDGYYTITFNSGSIESVVFTENE